MSITTLFQRVRPVGVMVELLGRQGDPRHEAERLAEVGELDLAVQMPVGQPHPGTSSQAALGFLVRQRVRQP